MVAVVAAHTAAAGLAAARPELRRRVRAVIAAGRGGGAGAADRVNAVRVPEPVVGVDPAAEAAAPLRGLGGYRNDDDGNCQQHHNQRHQHTDDLVQVLAAVVVVGGHGCAGVKRRGVRDRHRHMHHGLLAVAHRAEIPGQVIAVHAGVIGDKAVVIVPAHLHIFNAQVVEPAGCKREVCRTVIVFCEQMALVHAECKMYAALPAVGGGHIGRVVTVTEHDLGVAAAVARVL